MAHMVRRALFFFSEPPEDGSGEEGESGEPPDEGEEEASIVRRLEPCKRP